MSIRRGNKIIASRITNGFSLFDCKWSDHILNNISWLRADTFSWQSGDVYVAAYEHLLEDFENRVGKGTDSDGWLTETIDGVTVYYIVAPDGHKISVYDNEANIHELYEKTGVAWYYILDKANKRFKLPRTKFGFTGIRDGVGRYVEAGLPNIYGSFNAYSYGEGGGTDIVTSKIGSANALASGSQSSYNFNNFSINASRLSSVYGNSDTVQPKATEMYLYFYVGNYVEDITTIDAGKLAEAVNDFDIDTFKSEVDEVRNEAISDINQTTSDSVTQLKNMGEVVNYTNITNCITEIPQDIKLEIVDGVLTLKAGSTVYIPNGSGVFDKKTATEDVITLTGTYAGKFMIFDNGNLSGNTLRVCGTPHQFSGTTAPSSPQVDTTWYDTANNIVKVYQNSQWTGQRTLPLAIATFDNGVCVSIDQVFNGFGYIGSTIFALPGVKALIPDGRNEDGTLKNRNMTVQSVLTKTIPSNTGWHYMTFNSIGTEIDVATNYYTGTELPSGATSYSRFYNTAENNIYTVVSGKLTKFPQFILNCYIDHSTSSPYKINSMKQATAFNVVDYNDTGFIGHQAFPSNRYVDLTLGASSSYYTAPADGWFYLRKSATASGQYVYIEVAKMSIDFVYTTSNTKSYIMPCQRGDKVLITYTTAGATTSFRFIYANGSK